MMITAQTAQRNISNLAIHLVSYYAMISAIDVEDRTNSKRNLEHSANILNKLIHSNYTIGLYLDPRNPDYIFLRESKDITTENFNILSAYFVEKGIDVTTRDHWLWADHIRTQWHFLIKAYDVLFSNAIGPM